MENVHGHKVQSNGCDLVFYLQAHVYGLDVGRDHGYLKQLKVECMIQAMDSRRYALSVTVAKWVLSGPRLHTKLVMFFFCHRLMESTGMNQSYYVARE